LVTDDELNELLVDCPKLFHMAEEGSWPSISSHGLLSTSALLDLYQVEGSDRDRIEGKRRSSSVSIKKDGLGTATIRDQLPMDDKGLLRCLQDGLTPEDWYRLLNSKVFFWLTRQRLSRLLKAGEYRSHEHDVLVLDTAAIVKTHRDNIWLCSINSGCTKPFPHPRGNSTFRRIADYPYSDWRKKRPKGERVVEFAVDNGIPNIAQYVTKVVRMKGDDELKVIFTR
jgi:hypothetical protein